MTRISIDDIITNGIVDIPDAVTLRYIFEKIIEAIPNEASQTICEIEFKIAWDHINNQEVLQ